MHLLNIVKCFRDLLFQAHFRRAESKGLEKAHECILIVFQVIVDNSTIMINIGVTLDDWILFLHKQKENEGMNKTAITNRLIVSVQGHTYIFGVLRDIEKSLKIRIAKNDYLI